MGSGECTFHFAGNTIRFGSDDLDLIRALAAHFRHCAGAGGPIVANYELIAIDDACFQVLLDGDELFRRLTREQVLWHLMQDAIPRLNGAARNSLVLHAAALAQGGNGMLLCGQSGSGKSSLAAWLVADGLNYLTDEVVSIAGDDISGLCRSIVLKHGSAFIWKHWLKQPPAHGFLPFKDGTCWIDPTLFNPNAVQTNAKARLLIFPRYDPETDFRVEPLTAADALFRLLQCLVNARNFEHGGLTNASRLARQTSAFSLTYSNIEAASQWIKQTSLTL